MSLRIKDLCNDVLRHIYSFIPIKNIYVINKTSFLSNYPKIIADYNIKNAIFKKYINTVINNDCHFQMNILLKNNFDQWNNNNKWVYNYSTYPNYAIFIKELCIKKDSNKCKELILSFINKTSSNKIYKKIRTKKNKWSN
jgi:hypothetical protein